MEGSQLTPQPASTDPWSKPGTPAEHEHELHCAASHASNLILTTLEVQYRHSFFFMTFQKSGKGYSLQKQILQWLVKGVT